MRSFESPSPRGEQPETTDNTPRTPAPGEQPPAGQGSTGRAGGHVYRHRPTPGASAGAAGGENTPAGGRVYYSKKRNGAAQSPDGGTAARQSRFTSKQMRLNIMLGALILVLIISLVLAALLPGCRQAPPAATTSAGSLSTAPSLPVESYDKDKLAIPEGEYAGIILDETEDAGDAYVEETLFIGDSNTERMIQYDATGVTMKNGIGIASMGIGSVTGLKCVRFSGYNDMAIPQAVALMQPRRIVIMYGTNNVGMYTETFIDQYEYAIEAIEKAWPYADIIIGSVLPIGQNCSYGSLSQKVIDEFNLALVEMAKEHEYKFLNWSEALKDARTGYAKSGTLISDGVHISADGAELLADYFRTHSYVTDDTRPKPLKAVPTRLPTPEGLFPKPESSSSGSDISRSASGSASASASVSSEISSSVPETPSSQAPASITVSVAAKEGGTATGVAATGAPGTGVTLTDVTATASEGFVFAGWSCIAAFTENGNKITVNIPAGQTENIVLYATFTPVATESVAAGAAVVSAGATGTG